MSIRCSSASCRAFSTIQLSRVKDIQHFASFDLYSSLKVQSKLEKTEIGQGKYIRNGHDLAGGRNCTISTSTCWLICMRRYAEGKHVLRRKL